MANNLKRVSRNGKWRSRRARLRNSLDKPMNAALIGLIDGLPERDRHAGNRSGVFQQTR